jgi:large subunit ribosomal protein L25
MTKHTLIASNRTQTGRGVKKLRLQGQIPGHVFGKEIKSENLQVNTKEFKAIFSQVGESSLLYLQVSGQPQSKPVFISQVDRDPVSGSLLHVSFHQVDLKAKITAPVALKLTGESLAVKDGLGVLVQQLNEVEIEALPTDMPDHLDVDISSLAAVGDSLTLADLKLPKNLSAKSDPQSLVVKIEAHAKEETVPVAAPSTDTPDIPANPESPEPVTQSTP